MKKMTVLIMMVGAVLASTATASLIAHYDFENNLDNTGDTAGLNLTSSGSSAIAYSADAMNGSYAGSFNGSAWGTVDLPNLTQQTYAFWLKPTVDNDPRVFSSGQSVRTEVRILGQELLIYIAGSPKVDTRSSSKKDVPLSEWTHIAFTFDEGTGVVRGYVNGDNVVNTTTGLTMGDDADPTFFIGARAYNDGTSPVTGLMDDVRVYDTVLSGSEIAALVPEPATIGLLSFGCVAALFFRRIYMR